MSVLTDAAASALASALAAEETAREEQRKTLSQAATNALQAVLGTLTITAAGLTRVHRDFDLAAQGGVIVWSDGTIALAAQKRPGQDAWHVRLVTGSGADWTPKSDRLQNMVDLGRALAAG